MCAVLNFSVKVYYVALTISTKNYNLPEKVIQIFLLSAIKPQFIILNSNYTVLQMLFLLV